MQQGQIVPTVPHRVPLGVNDDSVDCPFRRARGERDSLYFVDDVSRRDRPVRGDQRSRRLVELAVGVEGAEAGGVRGEGFGVADELMIGHGVVGRAGHRGGHAQQKRGEGFVFDWWGHGCHS